MPPVDDSSRSRGASASHALLSAALGGLLSLSTSCGPSGDGSAADSGADRDLGGDVDASPATDSGAPVDSGVSVDAGATADAGPTDAGTPADAAAGDAAPPDDAEPPDAGVSMDATVAMDAAPPVDASRDAPCDVDPARMITATDAAPGMTLDEFTAMCDGLGGFIEIHPHCGGMNSCRGLSYDSGTGVLTEHTCAGLNTCTGFSCIIP